jgi:hypothetical protein
MTEEIHHKKQVEHGVVENHKQQAPEPPAKVPVVITVDSEEPTVAEESPSVESGERRVSIAMLLCILLAFAIEWSFARIEFFIPTSEMDPDWIEKLELHQVTSLKVHITRTC